jgi:predicted DNA-binding protein (UPF0251 family)
MPQLHIEYSEDLRDLVDEPPDHLAALAREALIVRLYDLDKLSSGQAARLLGLSRRAFLDLLDRYHVSLFDEATEVTAEARRGRS